MIESHLLQFCINHLPFSTSSWACNEEALTIAPTDRSFLSSRVFCHLANFCLGKKLAHSHFSSHPRTQIICKNHVPSTSSPALKVSDILTWNHSNGAVLKALMSIICSFVGFFFFIKCHDLSHQDVLQ